jgi:hypothetical protein
MSTYKTVTTEPGDMPQWRYFPAGALAARVLAQRALVRRRGGRLFASAHAAQLARVAASPLPACVAFVPAPPAPPAPPAQPGLF